MTVDKRAAIAKVTGAGLPKPPGAHVTPSFILEATYGFTRFIAYPEDFQKYLCSILFCYSPVCPL